MDTLHAMWKNQAPAEHFFAADVSTGFLRWPSLAENGVRVAVFSVWVPPRDNDDPKLNRLPANAPKEKWRTAYRQIAGEQLEILEKMEKGGGGKIVWIRGRTDLDLLGKNPEKENRPSGQQEQAGRLWIVAALEGGHALLTGNELLDAGVGPAHLPEVLARFYRRGMRIIGLTWNNSGPLATSAYHALEKPRVAWEKWAAKERRKKKPPPARKEAAELERRRREADRGLWPAGRKVIAEANRLGMIVDVAHASPQTIREACRIARFPVIASHANASAVCGHFRNLDDESIRAIAQTGGVIGVTFHRDFLNDDPDRASVEDVIRHIRYIGDLVGYEYVAIGSDWDGSDPPPDLAGPAALPRLATRLEKEFGRARAQAILSGNFLRVLRAALQ